MGNKDRLSLLLRIRATFPFSVMISCRPRSLFPFCFFSALLPRFVGDQLIASIGHYVVHPCPVVVHDYSLIPSIHTTFNITEYNKYRVFVNGFSNFYFFITQSYFKLHLQNIYQLKEQFKKFCEQKSVINKVQCEHHEWLSNIKPIFNLLPHAVENFLTSVCTGHSDRVVSSCSVVGSGGSRHCPSQ
jgi:hypothetical protein